MLLALKWADTMNKDPKDFVTLYISVMTALSLIVPRLDMCYMPKDVHRICCRCIVLFVAPSGVPITVPPGLLKTSGGTLQAFTGLCPYGSEHHDRSLRDGNVLY